MLERLANAGQQRLVALFASPNSAASGSAADDVMHCIGVRESEVIKIIDFVHFIKNA